MNTHTESITAHIQPNWKSATAMRIARRNLSNGVALANHIKSAHGGIFEPSCRACVELKQKVGA